MAANGTFFERLHEQRYEPLLKRISGTIALIADRPEGKIRWMATIRDGEIGFTRQEEEQRADACMEASAALFDALSDGRENAIAATLRGDLVVIGDLRLAVQLDPTAAGAAADARARVTSAGRRRRRMGEGLVRILDGATFAVSQGTGDIEPDPAEPTGLFSLDTRFISKWVLTVNGAAPQRALLRRQPVLRVELLPGAGAAHHVHGRADLRGPQAQRRRCPRGGADDSQPRRPRGGAAAADGRSRRTSPTSSRSRTAGSRRRASTTPRSRRTGCGWATGGTTSRGRPGSPSAGRPSSTARGSRRGCAWSRTPRRTCGSMSTRGR